LDPWCLRGLLVLGIKWYQFVSNAEVRRTSGQPLLTSTIRARRISLFRHSEQLNDSANAKKILTALPPEDWKWPPGRIFTNARSHG